MSLASRPTGGTSLPDSMGTSGIAGHDQHCLSLSRILGRDGGERFGAFCGQCRQNVYDFSQMTRRPGRGSDRRERGASLRSLLPADGWTSRDAGLSAESPEP